MALVLAALSLAVFTRPGRRAIRRPARWLDSRVEGFCEPNARVYARFVAPVLRQLYERVADDVAEESAELAGHSAARNGKDGDRPGLAILDVGCGPGDLATMLAERLPDARIVGLDLSPGMVELAKRLETVDGRIRFEVGDAAGLPFDAASFDIVVSTLSLHHWPNPGAGFSEIGRVLRPGGVALVYDLRLLTLEAGDLPPMARRAGLGASQLRLERLSGGLLSRAFVRFRVNRQVEAPAPEISPLRGQPAMLESRPLWLLERSHSRSSAAVC